MPMHQNQQQAMPEEYKSPILFETGNGILIFLDDSIVQETINPVIQAIVGENLSRPDLEHITLFIDSAGGDAEAAMKLIDVMSLSQIPIRTIGWGGLASAALLIFMCGDERLISRNTNIMSHQATFSANGFSAKMADFSSYNQSFSNISDRIMRIYTENTGLDQKSIKRSLLCSNDTWLTAEQAVEFGMADDILQNHAEVIWEIWGVVNERDGDNTPEGVTPDPEPQESELLVG